MILKRGYRTRTAELGAAIFGAVVFEVASFSSQVHLITGQPMVVPNGRGVGGPHIANSGELWFTVIGFGLFQLMSLGLFLRWLNQKITVDEQGIRAQNLLGFTVFQSAWIDLTAVRKRRGMFANATTFEVMSHSQKMKFDSMLPYYDDLMSLIERQCPYVDFSPWRGPA